MFTPNPGKRVEIIGVEEGPWEVVSHAYALDPSRFGGETRSAMEISECLFGGG